MSFGEIIQASEACSGLVELAKIHWSIKRIIVSESCQESTLCQGYIPEYCSMQGKHIFAQMPAAKIINTKVFQTSLTLAFYHHRVALRPCPTHPAVFDSLSATSKTQLFIKWVIIPYHPPHRGPVGGGKKWCLKVCLYFKHKLKQGDLDKKQQSPVSHYHDMQQPWAYWMPCLFLLSNVRSAGSFNKSEILIPCVTWRWWNNRHLNSYQILLCG